MAKIKVTQVKGTVARPARQKKTLIALGLKGLNQTVEHEDSPSILGMIGRVNHLVKVEQA